MRRLAAVVAVSGLLLASCTSSSKPHSAQSGSPSSPPSGSETPFASPSIRSSQSPSIRNGGTHPPVPSSPVSPVGNRDSSYPVVAAAAPVVVFATFSTNFRPSGIHYDGLVARDLAAGTSRRLWIPTQPDGTRNLVQPPAFAISADGRYIAFATSDATYKASLSALFLADRIKGTTRRLVGRSSSLCSVEGFSPVSISADGNTIVFFGRPYATEGARADRDGCNPSGHVYVFHVSTGIREIASVGFGTTEMPMDYIKPFVISPDGKHVAFWTSEPCDNQGTTTEHLYARDLSTKQTTLVSGDIATCSGADVRSEARRTSFSFDGTYLAFETNWALTADDRDKSTDVYVWSRGGTFRLVSGATVGGVSDSQSVGPSMSSDGRFITYVSNPSVDIPCGSYVHSACGRILVRDMTTGKTLLVSRSAAGGPAHGESLSPSISADGSWIAFESYAVNIIRHAYSRCLDFPCTQIFVRDIVHNTAQLVSVV